MKKLLCLLLLALPGTANAADPYAAFERGDYATALQGFQALQTQNPSDLDVLDHIASSHYRMGNFEAARRAYSQFLDRAPQELRAKVLYNLANSEARNGQFERALQHYREVLEREPTNEDAQHNMRVVQQLMQTPPPQPESGDGQREEQQRGESSKGQRGQSKAQDSDARQGDPEDEREVNAGRARPRDRDGDGIPNRVERRSEYGSDPRNPDSDGDGIPDGEEDKNRNGKVDRGETDPTKADSDGDGIPDGSDARPTDPSQQLPERSPSDGLSPEEADRYLRALEERPPVPPLRRRSGVMQEKDW